MVLTTRDAVTGTRAEAGDYQTCNVSFSMAYSHCPHAKQKQLKISAPFYVYWSNLIH